MAIEVASLNAVVTQRTTERDAAVQQGRNVPDDSYAAVVHHLTEQLARVFQVSPQIIQYRIEDERLIEPVGI